MVALAVAAMPTVAVADAPSSTLPAPAGFSEALPHCDVAVPDGEVTEPAFAEGDTLQVAAYNILFASGSSNASLDARVPLIIDAILDSDADVVGVQEDELIGTRGYTSERIAQGLAAATGEAWEWCFFMANPIIPDTPDTYPGGGNPESDPLMVGNSIGETVWRTGISVVSRFPIVEGGAHRFPRRVAEEAAACGTNITCFFTANVESRAALRVLVDTPGGPVHVVSTHLAHTITPFSGASRLVQANSLVEWIDKFSYGSPYPVILTGDFNSGQGSAVHQAVLDGGFTDTFRVANPEAVGATSGQSINNPNPTVGSSRIDFVFSRPGSCPSPLGDGDGILQSSTFGDTPAAVGPPYWPSDHYGVVTTFAPFAHDPDECDVTYTARYTPEQAATLHTVALAFGVGGIEDVIRLGVNGLVDVYENGGATPGGPVANEGSVQVTVTWSAQEAAAIEAAAAGFGIDGAEFHHGGGRLVLALLWLAIHGQL